jgi:hypothetical protein
MFTVAVHNLTVAASWVVQAASGRQAMLKVKSAALKIPTAGLVWFFALGTPQMKEALLHHVRLHCWICNEPGAYPS